MLNPYRIPIIVIACAKTVGITAVSIHHPNLWASGAIRPEDDLRSVRRPRGTTVHLGNEGILTTFTGVIGFICFGQPSQTAAVPIGDPDFVIPAGV